MKVLCDSIVTHHGPDKAPQVTREQIVAELQTGATPLVYQGDGSTEVHFSANNEQFSGGFRLKIPAGAPCPYTVDTTYELTIA